MILINVLDNQTRLKGFSFAGVEKIQPDRILCIVKLVSEFVSRVVVFHGAGSVFLECHDTREVGTIRACPGSQVEHRIAGIGSGVLTCRQKRAADQKDEDQKAFSHNRSPS